MEDRQAPPLLERSALCWFVTTIAGPPISLKIKGQTIRPFLSSNSPPSCLLLTHSAPDTLATSLFLEHTVMFPLGIFAHAVPAAWDTHKPPPPGFLLLTMQMSAQMPPLQGS